MNRNLLTTEFYKLPKWITKVKGLQLVDWIVYCVAYSHRSLSEKNENIDKDGRIFFYLTNEGLRQKLGMGRRQIQSSVRRLKKCGAVIGERRVGQATRYFLETNPASIIFNIEEHQKDPCPGGAETVPQEELLESTLGNFSKVQKGPINKIEYIKKEISEIDKVREGLLEADITPSLKDKLMEYIDYRERIGKKVNGYDSIERIIGQIGSAFRDEQHLIESINETFMYEYQGIFPAKLKKAVQPADTVESNALRRLRMLREQRNGGNNE